MSRSSSTRIAHLIVGCWLVALTPSATAQESKAETYENITTAVFDVYPPNTVVSRRAAGTDLGVEDIGVPGRPVAIRDAFKHRTDEGFAWVVVRSKGDLSEQADPRIWWRGKFMPPSGDGEQTISIYLHPKNKLQYIFDFPFYLPKTFAATFFTGLGLVLFTIRRTFDVTEAKRRAAVLADAGMEYERPFGSWLVIGKLGSGGMGEVLKAFPADDIRREKMVAIKLRTGLGIDNPSPELAERDAEDRRRFQTETKVLATLDHPGIVKIYDWGVHDGQDYYVMDLVAGESLQSYLDRSPKPPLNEVRSLFVQLLEVMIFAHSKGILHRDLKPLNILRDAKGHLTVIDFGLARDQNQTVAFTQHGMPFVGSLEYMDPRVSLQMFNKIQATPSDQGTDQFALGGILFLLLTGKMAIELPEELGPQGLMPVLMQLSEPRRSTRDFRPDLPEELHRVVDSMLAIELAGRFPNLSAARAAFVQAIDPVV